MEEFHTPVLLKNVIEYLNIKPGGTYIDCTLGGGGHSSNIIKKLNPKGRLLSIDIDSDSIEYVREKYSGIYSNWIFEYGNFSKLKESAEKNQIDKADGIVFDLGVSSHQLEDSDRGFSYSGKGVLDMRMDKSLSVKASDLLNGLYEKELRKLFKAYGEESFTNQIVREILQFRKNTKIDSSRQLIDIIQKAVPYKYQKKARMRVFQALRIAINDELNSLSKALPQALGILANKGRLLVISFHSLEDRIVKIFFSKCQKEGLGIVIEDEIIVPDEEEKKRNPRSRSAKLRIFEKNEKS